MSSSFAEETIARLYDLLPVGSQQHLQFPLDDGSQTVMAISVKISITSFYVVCMSLDSKTYTIPKAGISFFPFDSKYGVKLIFKEDTFGDNSATVQLKVCTNLDLTTLFHISLHSVKSPDGLIFSLYSLFFFILSQYDC